MENVRFIDTTECIGKNGEFLFIHESPLFLKTFGLVIGKADEIGCLLTIDKNCLRKIIGTFLDSGENIYYQSITILRNNLKTLLKGFLET